MNTQNTLPPQGMSRAKDVLKFVPVCRSTLWNMVKDGKFPKPIKLSGKITAWRNADVLAWLEAQGGNA